MLPRLEIIDKKLRLYILAPKCSFVYVDFYDIFVIFFFVLNLMPFFKENFACYLNIFYI